MSKSWAIKCGTKSRNRSKQNFSMVTNCFLQAKLETKALKAKRPGFTDERYNETSYYLERESGEFSGLDYYYEPHRMKIGHHIPQKPINFLKPHWFPSSSSRSFQQSANANRCRSSSQKIDLHFYPFFRVGPFNSSARLYESHF